MGTSALEFEKPLAELEKQIEEVRKVAEEQKLDVDQQIAPLQAKLGEMRADVYKNLTPLQRVQVARSARRPLRQFPLVRRCAIRSRWVWRRPCSRTP